MDKVNNSTSPQLPEGLAYVCAHLHELRPQVRKEAIPLDPIETLILALRADEDIQGPLDRLHAILQREGDALGVYGHTGAGAGTRGLRPLGVNADPVETVYVCPAQRCSRYWWPQAGALPPHCRLLDERLRRKVL